MELLRDARLRPVCTQPGARKVQQGRIVEPLGFRRHRVADADIDLHREPRLPEQSSQPHPLSAIDVLHPDWRYLHRLWQVRHAVGLDRDIAGLPKDPLDLGCREIAVAKEVRIAGWPGRLSQPDTQKHGALENEAVGMLGASQPMEEAFEAVPGQNDIGVGTDGSRVIQ